MDVSIRVNIVKNVILRESELLTVESERALSCFMPAIIAVSIVPVNST